MSPRLGMVDCSGSSPVRHFPSSGQPSPRLLVRRFERGLGHSPPGCYRFRLLVSGGSSIVNTINAREFLAVEYKPRQFHLLVSNSTVAVFAEIRQPWPTSSERGALDLRCSAPLFRGSSTGRSRSIWFSSLSSSRAGAMFWRTPCLAPIRSRGQSGL